MDYGSLAAMAGKLIGVFFGVVVIFILAVVVYLDIWLKFHTRGKVIGIFVDNKSIFSALLSIENGNQINFGKGDKREMYLLEDEKQFLSLYPAGLPRFLQIPVRTYWYIRNNSVPLNITGKNNSGLTARMLRMISDEAMVRQTWKDVREGIGLRKQATGSSLGLYLVFACLAVSAFNLFMTMQSKTAIAALTEAMKKAFGQ